MILGWYAKFWSDSSAYGCSW